MIKSGRTANFSLLLEFETEIIAYRWSREDGDVMHHDFVGAAKISNDYFDNVFKYYKLPIRELRKFTPVALMEDSLKY